MPWERPIGFEDPMNAWENEELAYDEDIATLATSIPLPAEIWTGWLIFDFRPFIAHMFWCVTNCPTARYSFDVEGWDGSTWDRWLTIMHTSGPRQDNVRLPPYTFSRVRIRFKHHGAGWLHGELDDVRIDRTCGGPLQDFCGYFATASNFFYDLALNIEGVTFVGPSLSAPFEWLSERLAEAHDFCCEASGWLLTLQDEIREGVSLERINALIAEIWPEWYDLITDPISWLRVKLYTLSPDLYGLITVPDIWIRAFLTEHLNLPLDFWDDFPASLSRLVLGQYPGLLDFIEDPAGFIADQLELLFPDLRELISDPVSWLRRMIYELSPDLYGIMTTPDIWLKAKLTELLDLPEDFWDRFPASLLEWLLSEIEERIAYFAPIMKRMGEKILLYLWEG